ncbi:Ubiquitin-like protease domain-containing protein [Abeliophyllum distichum]|uniref:Ubiquitin-like protease domain-containing protein n=1 Tax=Abeliophyllum distichum TaxID=126358 RepID=A0ABD1SJF5_9LAMI
MRMKFNSLNESKATCTYCLFDFKIRSLFDQFMKDIKVIDSQSSLMSYITGSKIWFGNNWGDIDHVFIPVFMDKRAHWILAHSNIAHSHLDVYNSCYKTIRDVAVLDAIEPLRHIILRLIRRTKVLSYVTPYASLSYILCKDIPQQTNG